MTKPVDSVSIQEMPLPWHRGAWDVWSSRIQNARVPSAIILAGPEGLGKGLLAELFARALLCQERAGDSMPCGQCPGCRQYSAGSHPDLLRLRPGNPGKPIVVDQVREFSRRLFLTSHHGGARVGLIAPLEAMNVNASNSFLKTLEEPPSNVYLIAVSQRLLSLPATIRSRCQVMHVRRPSREDALAWLQDRIPQADPVLLEQAGGAPLKVLSLHEAGHLERVRRWSDGLTSLLAGKTSPLKLASEWEKEPLEDWLQWAMTWLMDVYRLKLGLPAAQLGDREANTAINRSVRQLSWHRLRRLHAETVEASRLLTTQANPRLLLESLLISWSV